MCYLRTALDNLEPNVLVLFWTPRGHRWGEGDRFPWALASSRALLCVDGRVTTEVCRAPFKVPIEEGDHETPPFDEPRLTRARARYKPLSGNPPGERKSESPIAYRSFLCAPRERGTDKWVKSHMQRMSPTVMPRLPVFGLRSSCYSKRETRTQGFSAIRGVGYLSPKPAMPSPSDSAATRFQLGKPPVAVPSLSV